MDIISVILWTAIGYIGLRAVASHFNAEERRWLGYAYVMHIVFAVLHVFVVERVLGGGDMFWYHRAGSELADLWRTDPDRWTGEIIKLSLRQEASFPFWVHGAAGGTSTGAMFGISTWFMLLCGKSLYGACVLVSVLNFFSRMLIYSVFRRVAEPQLHRYLLWATMLLPSAVFWTAGLLKESVAMIGVGVAVFGAYMLAEKGAFLRGIGLIALGGFTSYLVKPYVLFPFFVAAPVWYLAAKLKRDSSGAAVLLTPMRFVMFGALLVVGLGVLAVAVPSLSVESLGDELAAVQYSGTTVTGTTNYSLVDAETASKGGRGQLLYAPLGLFFALTRPWFFEARSPQLLIATLESTLLLWVLVRSVLRLGLRSSIRRLLGEPWLLFCLCYVLIFGVAVGLGSTNVGSLSRYRVPMMLFYAAVVASIYEASLKSPSASLESPLMHLEAQPKSKQGLQPQVVGRMPKRALSGRRSPLRVRR